MSTSIDSNLEEELKIYSCNCGDPKHNHKFNDIDSSSDEEETLDIGNGGVMWLPSSWNKDNGPPPPIPPRPHTISKSNESGSRGNLIFYVAGIYVCYMIFGLLHENLYSKFKFDSSSIVLLFLTFFNGLIAGIVNFIRKRKILKSNNSSLLPPSIPLFRLFLISIPSIGANLAANEALSWGGVDYPTQVLLKSCKPLAVMLLSFLVYRKKQSLNRIIGVSVLSFGVYIFFQQIKTKHVVDESDHLWSGVALLGVSLILDGIYGPMIDNQMRKAASTHELNIKPMSTTAAAWINGFSFVWMLIYSFYTGKIDIAISTFEEHPDLFGELLTLSVCSAIGQLFIYQCVTEFDSLTVSLVTATRKFFTILLSVVVGSHPLNNYQWLGVFLVFGGIFIDSLSKSKSKKKKID